MAEGDRSSNRNGSAYQHDNRQMPPPPSQAPGWLSHVPAIPPEQFPRSQLPHVYDGQIRPSTEAARNASPAWNLHLLNHHPAYALPPTFGSVQRSRNQSDSPVPGLGPQHCFSDFPNDARITNRGLSDPLTSQSNTNLPPPEQQSYLSNYPPVSLLSSSNVLHPHADGLPSDVGSGVSRSAANTPGHDASPKSPFPPEKFGTLSKIAAPIPPIHTENWRDAVPWSTNMSAFPSAPGQQHVLQHPQTPEINPASYSTASSSSTATASWSQPVSIPARYVYPTPPPPPSGFADGVAEMGSSGDDSADDEDATDIEETPGVNWPGRNRKRKLDEITPAKKPRGRPRKNLHAQAPEERKRGRRKGELRGPRETLDPGPKWMKIYNDALDSLNEENDLDKAQRLVLRAIEHNPEIYAGHKLLAEIHFARGDHEHGFNALMMGLHAHLSEIELWRQTAETILSYPAGDRQNKIERARYCYTAIVRKDGKDMDARFQRAECHRLMGMWNGAFNDMKVMLNDDPHNSSVLAAFAKLCRDINDINQAITAYDEHFDFYKVNGLTDEQHFTWMDVGQYVDLMVDKGETAQAIVIFKRLARWVSGRQDETFWEEFIEDDREFDQMHYPRRTQVGDFVPNRYPEHNYGEALPLDLRAKLGVLRLKLNFREEAQAHFDWLEPEVEGEESLVEDYSDSFYEIAKALHDAKEHAQALHFYSALHNADIDLGLEFKKDFAASLHVCGQLDRACSLYGQALELDPESIPIQMGLTNVYVALGDRTMALKHGNEVVLKTHDKVPAPTSTRKYERKEDRLEREAAERALKNAYKLPKNPGDKKPGRVPKGLQYRNRYRRKFERWVPEWDTPPRDSPVPITPFEAATKAAQPSSPTPDSDPAMYDKPIRIPRKTGRPKKDPRLRRKAPTQENAVKHYEEMQALYRTLCIHQEDMRDGDEYAINVWMDCATAMLEDFRNVKVFYPRERHKQFEGYNMQTPRPRPATSDPDALEVATPQPATFNGILAEAATLYTTGPVSEETVRTLAPPGRPDEYCGIRFAIWLDIFLELALLQANSASSDAQQECYMLINACIDCNVFYHDNQSMAQIHSCFLACCLALGDDLTLYNIVLRWFMREYTFCTDTYRLYSAITLLNELPANKDRFNSAVYKSSPNQKFIFRQMVGIDKSLPEDYNAGTQGGVPAFMRQDRASYRKRRYDPAALDPAIEVNGTPNSRQARASPISSVSATMKVHTPTEMDAVLFILYANIMMASNSFSNALSYLYRAYSLDPKNCVCLLSMAFCYMHELFKRQTGNRHAFALMGWAWFGKYEEERMKWAVRADAGKEAADDEKDDGVVKMTTKMVDVVKREIEFNRARCWEMLGMADLGMQGYQRVLDLTPKKSSGLGHVQNADDVDEIEQDGEEHWTMEAAYAMATVYAMNGNNECAREITEKYLVVE